MMTVWIAILLYLLIGYLVGLRLRLDGTLYQNESYIGWLLWPTIGALLIIGFVVQPLLGQLAERVDPYWWLKERK